MTGLAHLSSRNLLSGLAVSFLMALAVAVASWAADANNLAPITLVPPGHAVSFPREYFGMHIHNPEKPGHWPTVPFGSRRLWDAGVSWADMERMPGQWDFSRLDNAVDQAHEAGVSVLLTLGMTPTWASARPSEKAPYGPGQAAEPANIEEWRQYVRAVATRYRGRIEAYEIWNEPNLKMFWTGDIPKLVELTRVAYEEIKRADPSALVVSPSPTEFGTGPKWIREFLDAGGASFVDVIGYHLYNHSNPPETLVPKIEALKALLASGGYANKPLWNTETGLLINNLKPAHDVTWNPEWQRERIDPALAADFVVRTFLITRALGFERYYWYAWDNRWLGFIEPSDLSMKAPGEAYGRAVSYLMRSTLERCDRDKVGLWTCQLKLANGRSALAMWVDPAAPQQQQKVASPFAANVVHFDERSTVLIASGQAIELGAGVALAIQAP